MYDFPHLGGEEVEFGDVNTRPNLSQPEIYRVGTQTQSSPVSHLQSLEMH